MDSIPYSVAEKLKHYVYLYVDPRDGLPFYVGKGRKNRALTHLKDVSETEKVKRINELKKLNKEPIIEILKYGLSDHEAILIESIAIELLGLHQLTNVVKGHQASENGRGKLSDIVQELIADEIKIEDAVILINISRLYRYGMSEIELYDVTRGIWKINPSRHNAKYAFSIFGGIVRAVYLISAWVSAGSTMTHRDYSEIDYEFSERYEFVGKLADNDIQKKYLGKSVKQYFDPGAQNPIKYVNC